MESASVTGTGALSIADGTGGSLTATITFADIDTFGATGGVQTVAEANVTGISYTAGTTSIFDFVALAASPAATQRITSRDRLSASCSTADVSGPFVVVVVVVIDHRYDNDNDNDNGNDNDNEGELGRSRNF